MNRRTFLQAGVLSPLGLGLGQALWLRSPARGAAVNGKAKACILLFMTGGPAQQETFDPKPDAPEGIRGEFGPTATNVPGVQICEHLPMLARLADRYAILRSVWHGSDTHGVGVHYNLTGLRHTQRAGGEPPTSGSSQGLPYLEDLVQRSQEAMRQSRQGEELDGTLGRDQRA